MPILVALQFLARCYGPRPKATLPAPGSDPENDWQTTVPAGDGRRGNEDVLSAWSRSVTPGIRPPVIQFEIL
jgi:hypothetical protein